MTIEGDRKMRARRIERGGFVLFLALVTVGLIWVAWPFASAILWAALAAIIFQPLFALFQRHLGGSNRAAILTLLAVTVLVIVPAIWIGNIIVDQATRLYLALQTQQIDPAAAFDPEDFGPLLARVETGPETWREEIRAQREAEYAEEEGEDEGDADGDAACAVSVWRAY